MFIPLPPSHALSRPPSRPPLTEPKHMSNTSKIVLITGATAGIGRTTALHLAKLGHHVIATGRKQNELTKLAHEATGLRLDTVSLDVTSAASISAAVTEVSR